jgi:hypothetical protein
MVAGAAVAGVLVASGLVFAATGPVADDKPPGGTPVAARPDEPTRQAPETSTRVGFTSAAADNDGATSTAVTVDVPRSEQVAPAGLHPDSVASPASRPPTDAPRVITDPVDVARTYLVAAESVTARDAGQRLYRACPYMAPSHPAATAGLLVSEPPPAGHSRTIEVLAVAEQARNDDLGRIAYKVTYQRHVSPAIPATAALPDGARRTTFIVVELQASGGWLVLSQAAHLDPAD